MSTLFAALIVLGSLVIVARMVVGGLQPATPEGDTQSEASTSGVAASATSRPTSASRRRRRRTGSAPGSYDDSVYWPVTRPVGAGGYPTMLERVRGALVVSGIGVLVGAVLAVIAGAVALVIWQTVKGSLL